MPVCTYTPLEGKEINIGQYMPGLQSEVAGRWGRHPIPGQQGSLKEDLGNGDLKTRVTLQFVGKTANDYYPVMSAIERSRRGTLLHPRRGSRQTIINNIRESIDFVGKGNETTIVDIEFEDWLIGQAYNFKAGPSGRSQQVVSEATNALALVGALKTLIFSRPNLSLRALMLTAETNVSTATTLATNYAAAAQESFTLGLYDPLVQAQLLAIPAVVQLATQSLQNVAGASDIQPSVNALEVMLFAATQLDVAIRAAQPVPVERVVTRSPGQSVYAFVQQWYGRSQKTPAQMRDTAALILRINPSIRTPLLIPQGTVVVSPAL